MDSPTNSTHFLKLVVRDIPVSEEDIVSFKLFEMGAFGVSQDLAFKQESQQYDPEILEKEAIDLQAFFEIEKKESLENSEWIKNYKAKISVEKNRDWLSEWKKHFKSFEVFKGLWIVPSWEKDTFEKQVGDHCIYIEPGLAFGTGTHATTKLCLKSISDLLDQTSIKSSLDLGSGSSVLSIFLKQKGVEDVMASEIDALARENGEYNLKFNDVKDTLVYAPDDASLKREFDLVVANIIDGVLLKLKDQILSKKAKHIILCGILTENKERLMEAFTEDTGYRVESSDHMDEWSLLKLIRD